MVTSSSHMAKNQSIFGKTTTKKVNPSPKPFEITSKEPHNSLSSTRARSCDPFDPFLSPSALRDSWKTRRVQTLLMKENQVIYLCCSHLTLTHRSVVGRSAILLWHRFPSVPVAANPHHPPPPQAETASSRVNSSKK